MDGYTDGVGEINSRPRKADAAHAKVPGGGGMGEVRIERTRSSDRLAESGVGNNIY